MKIGPPQICRDVAGSTAQSRDRLRILRIDSHTPPGKIKLIVNDDTICGIEFGKAHRVYFSHFPIGPTSGLLAGDDAGTVIVFRFALYP